MSSAPGSAIAAPLLVSCLEFNDADGGFALFSSSFSLIWSGRVWAPTFNCPLSPSTGWDIVGVDSHENSVFEPGEAGIVELHILDPDITIV